MAEHDTRNIPILDDIIMDENTPNKDKTEPDFDTNAEARTEISAEANEWQAQNNQELNEPNHIEPTLNASELDSSGLDNAEWDSAELYRPDFSDTELNDTDLSSPELSNPALNNLELAEQYAVETTNTSDVSSVNENYLENTKPDTPLPTETLTETEAEEPTETLTDALTEAPVFESALIDYQNEENDENQNPVDFAPAADVENEISPLLSLETIVDDVVKQLMPELEQQLRDKLLQALEDKIPSDKDSL